MDKKNSIGIVETKYFTFGEGSGGLLLESGRRLSSVTLAYETYGRLNREKSNAVLVLHALSADAHAAGFHEDENKAGWREAMIGPGKAFDTEKYFVICSNRSAIPIATALKTSPLKIFGKIKGGPQSATKSEGKLKSCRMTSSK